MRFCESDCFFVYFPLLLQRKDTKGKQPRQSAFSMGSEFVFEGHRMRFCESDCFLVYFPLLLQRKDTKGKQPGKPFCRKVSRDSSKEEGHLRTKRRKCFPLTKLFITPPRWTRASRRGGFWGCSGSASHLHELLLSVMGKRIPPTKPDLQIFNFPTNPNLNSSFVKKSSPIPITLTTKEPWGSSASGSRRYPTRGGVGALERSGKVSYCSTGFASLA